MASLPNPFSALTPGDWQVGNAAANLAAPFLHEGSASFSGRGPNQRRNAAIAGAFPQSRPLDFNGENSLWVQDLGGIVRGHWLSVPADSGFLKASFRDDKAAVAVKTFVESHQRRDSFARVTFQFLTLRGMCSALPRHVP